MSFSLPFQMYNSFMKIIIDTSNKDLYVALIKDGETLRYKLQENLVKKADALPGVFLEVMEDVKAKEITDFYITLGPGSFTGARTGLVFARSICQITKANLHTTSSIQLIAGPSGTKEVFIDARSKKSYYAEVNDGKLQKGIELAPFEESTIQAYDELIKNPDLYLPIFKKEEDIFQVHPYYIKDAKIGGN